ncbi:MAG: glycerate kinase type-2 family protein [Acidimicrobiia bacterium]
MIRNDFLSVFHSAVAAVDPESATMAAISVSGTDISFDGTRFTNVTETPWVVAVGKGACAMARGVASAVGPVRGIAVSDHVEESPVDVVVGGHPIPDDRSVAAGERLLRTVRSVAPDDLVVFCISGGGSALAEVPVAGIDVSDVADLNRTLIASGLPIEAINDVRSSISRIKGGRLAEACASDRHVTLVLSDVVGAGPEAVASGPSLGYGLGSVSDESIAMLADRGVSPAVVHALEASQPLQPEGDQPFVVIGSSVTSATGAVGALAERGIEARVWTSSLMGDVEEAVDGLIAQLGPAGTTSGEAVVATGEVTVRITGPSSGGALGGRNQHAALAAARRIQGTDIVFGAFGTDGRDGPTDAAGAIVDGGTVARMARKGVDVADALATFTSYDALAASGDLVICGPTGTNVADLWMIGRQA